MIERYKFRWRMPFFRQLYYWLVTPTIIMFAAAVVRIPPRWNRLLAPLVGRILLFGKREAVLRNMEKVLGDSVGNPLRASELWQKHIARLGRTIIETTQLSNMPVDELRRRISLRGEEHLRSALQLGRGVVLLVHHVGNLSLIGPAVGLRGFRICIASNAMPITYIENRFNQFLDRCGTDRVALGQDILLVAKTTLQNNGVFAAIVDYSVKGKHTEWVEFGNAELQVSLVPAIIALRNRAVILAADVLPLGDNRYEISVQPVASYSTAGDLHVQALSIVQDAIKHVNAELQQQPEQWWRWDYARIRETARESTVHLNRSLSSNENVRPGRR